MSDDTNQFLELQRNTNSSGEINDIEINKSCLGFMIEEDGLLKSECTG